MKNQPKRVLKMNSRLKARQTGSVLIEAMIGILIFSFGILALAGLQGAMMKNTAEATYRAEAAYIVQQELGRLQVQPYGIGFNTVRNVDNLPNGRLRVTALSQSRLQFIVTWQSKGAVDAAKSGWDDKENPVHSYVAVTSLFTAR